VYIVQFNTGALKVGRTGDPAVRLKNYATHGRPHGIGVNGHWISQPHLGAKRTEEALVEYCRTAGTTLNDGEFFAGIETHDLLEYAMSLNVPEALGAIRCGSPLSAVSQGVVVSRRGLPRSRHSGPP